MRIGILTLPLHTNYGGILQAYALQKVLSRMGHQVMIVNLPLAQEGKKGRTKEFLKRMIKRYLLFKKVPLRAWPTCEERKIIAKHITPFIQQNLCVVECSRKEDLLSITKKEKLDGYVVGSDQVWRPAYSSSVSSFFLDFLNDQSFLRISYAASFGMDMWLFTEKESDRFGSLLKKFDAVSVREDSAVSLCKEHWNIEADLVLDPTLLLDKQDYMELGGLKATGDHKTIMVYILDMNIEKKNIIKKVSDCMGLPVNRVMAKEKYWHVGSAGIEDCIVPPVSEWLSGFVNAEFVVTDSFHGMVFSILFGKSFVCIGNKSRGMTRFTSLLKLLKLEDRLIFRPEELDLDKIQIPIPYEQVEAIRKEEKNKSLLFLSHAMKDKV